MSMRQPLPNEAYHDGKLDFLPDCDPGYDGVAAVSLLEEVIWLTGLEPTVKNLRETYAADACKDPRKAETGATVKTIDPIFAAIERKRCSAATYRMMG